MLDVVYTISLALNTLCRYTFLICLYVLLMYKVISFVEVFFSSFACGVFQLSYDKLMIQRRLFRFNTDCLCAQTMASFGQDCWREKKYFD